MKLINISENFHDHPFLSLLKAFPSKKNPSKYALGLFPFRSFFSGKNSKRNTLKNEENLPF